MAAEDLCTLADVRLALELDAADTSRDTLIQGLITDASLEIMAEVNREIAPKTVATRRFRVDLKRQLQGGAVLVSLSPYDLAAATSVTLNPETATPNVLAALTDYVLDPEPAKFGVYTALRLQKATVFSSPTVSTFGFAYLDVAGSWGFPAVPAAAKRACVLTVMSWLRRDISAFAFAPKDDGELKPAVDPSYSLPPAARRKLWPLYRQRAF